MSAHPFFFYGSLMDVDLLEAVLGRPTPDLTFIVGWLRGYVADTAERYSFPTLVEHRTGRVDGVLVNGLTAADTDRIAYFEDEDYMTTVADIAIAGGDVAAQFYIATTRLKSSGKRWSFEHWRIHDKPLLLAVTRKVMSEHYGVTPMSEIDAVWHRVKAELEGEMHAPVPLKPRTAAATRAAPRRAKRAASPTRLPRRR